MDTPYSVSINDAERSPLMKSNTYYTDNNGILKLNDGGDETIAKQLEHFGSHGNFHSEKKVNVRYAIWNLFNDVLSPGTVALPYYIYQAGLPTGIILLVVFGLLTYYTCMDVYLMYMRYGKKNYPDLCNFVFGRPGYWLVCAAIFVFNFGGVCAQMMLFGSVVPAILTDFFGHHELFTKTYVILFGIAVFLPISFLKDITKYTFTSFVSVTCVFIITLLVVFRLIHKVPGDYAPPSPDPYEFVHKNTVFAALGGMAYIYVCQDLSFNIITGLENPTPRRYRKVVGITMFGTVLACGLIGVSGYLLFFDKINSANILDSFPTTGDTVATIGRVLLMVDATMTIPFTCFMPRISIISALSTISPKAKKWAHTRTVENIVTIVVVLSAVAISISVNNLGDFFELIGGLSACTLGYLLPPLLLLKQVGLTKMHPAKGALTVISLLCGIVILVGSTGSVLGPMVVDLFHHPHNSTNTNSTSTYA